MNKRFISEPLLDLLLQVGITPDEVDGELERQANRWAHTLLRHSHPYVRCIRDVSGLDVVGISRRYRRLLVEIEQPSSSGSPKWRYKEAGRATCMFGCESVIPESAAVALLGRPLRDLIKPFPGLSKAKVEKVVAVTDGWIDLTVEPSWQTF